MSVSFRRIHGFVYLYSEEILLWILKYHMDIYCMYDDICELEFVDLKSDAITCHISSGLPIMKYESQGNICEEAKKSIQCWCWQQLAIITKWISQRWSLWIGSRAWWPARKKWLFHVTLGFGDPGCYTVWLGGFGLMGSGFAGLQVWVWTSKLLVVK